MEFIHESTGAPLAGIKGREFSLNDPILLNSLRVAEKSIDQFQMRDESFYQYLQSDSALFGFKSAIPYVNYLALSVGHYQSEYQEDNAPELIVGDIYAPMASLVVSGMMSLEWASELTYRLFSMYHLVDNELGFAARGIKGSGFGLWGKQAVYLLKKQFINIDVTDFNDPQIPVWDAYSAKICKTGKDGFELLKKDFLLGLGFQSRHAPTGVQKNKTYDFSKVDKKVWMQNRK